MKKLIVYALIGTSVTLFTKCHKDDNSEEQPQPQRVIFTFDKEKVDNKEAKMHSVSIHYYDDSKEKAVMDYNNNLREEPGEKYKGISENYTIPYEVMSIVSSNMKDLSFSAEGLLKAEINHEGLKKFFSQTYESDNFQLLITNAPKLEQIYFLGPVVIKALQFPSDPQRVASLKQIAFAQNFLTEGRDTFFKTLPDRKGKEQGVLSLNKKITLTAEENEALTQRNWKVIKTEY